MQCARIALSRQRADSKKCAGTAVEEARATLQAMLLYILQCRKTLAEIKVAVPGFSIDAIVVERMAAVCAMALGAVMSGMGDLKTFKLLRYALSYIGSCQKLLAAPPVLLSTVHCFESGALSTLGSVGIFVHVLQGFAEALGCVRSASSGCKCS